MDKTWFRHLRLALSPDDFRALPRNAAYKYEYLDGEAWLTPRPLWYHAVLPLETFAPPEAPAEKVTLRPLGPDDWEGLYGLFAAALGRVQPFAGLDGPGRDAAVRACLDQTRAGGDGPLIGPACFVAAGDVPGAVCGAILVTLVPTADPAAGEPLRWGEPPPADAVERRLGQPHLTWVFVAPPLAGHGVGTALLAAAVRALLGLGYGELATTFLLGNESSTLWHWRNGFRLLPHMLSPRELRRRWSRGTD
jgi:GNAT superfamily N-acetyltransferase